MLASYRRPGAVTSMSRSHSWDRTLVLTLPDEVTASCYKLRNQGTHPQVPGVWRPLCTRLGGRALCVIAQMHLPVLLLLPHLTPCPGVRKKNRQKIPSLPWFDKHFLLWAYPVIKFLVALWLYLQNISSWTGAYVCACVC